MAIHVAALKANWEKPGSYKEFTRRALEQEQTLAGSPSTVALADLPTGAVENCRPEQNPDITRVWKVSGDREKRSASQAEAVD